MCTTRDDVENFVLKDGGRICDGDYRQGHCNLRSDIEGHMPPGLPEDNTEPNDPILDYDFGDLDTDIEIHISPWTSPAFLP